MPRIKRFRTSDEKELLQHMFDTNPLAFQKQAELILGGYRTFEDPAPRLDKNGNYVSQAHVDLRELRAWIREKLKQLPQAVLAPRSIKDFQVTYESSRDTCVEPMAPPSGTLLVTPILPLGVTLA